MFSSVVCLYEVMYYFLEECVFAALMRPCMSPYFQAFAGKITRPNLTAANISQRTPKPCYIFEFTIPFGCVRYRAANLIIPHHSYIENACGQSKV